MTVNTMRINLFSCQGCGAWHEYRPEVCAVCLSDVFDAQSVPAVGSLASWTTIRKPPLAHRDHGPYHVAVIDLDVGLRTTARLSLPTDQAEAVHVGDAVVLRYQVDSGGHRINVFEVAGQRDNK